MVINALLPGGALWTPETDVGLDQLLDGVAENTEEVRLFLAKLATLRNPLETVVLSDLEKEFGIFGTEGLTEDERRQRLLAVITSRDSDGTAEFMETALRASGFDVFVHINNPPVDPVLFINEQFVTICNNSTAICGRSDAVCGGAAQGELVVNGDVFYHPHAFSVVSGGKFAICDNQFANCGAIDAIESIKIEYDIPVNPGYWGLFFFVGGPATRNPSTGALEVIEFSQVPIARREELRRLIVKYKPMYSWCGLIAEFI